MSLFKKIRSYWAKKQAATPLGVAGHALSTQDTQAAIAELSSVVRNNPDTVEVYLALGNLYRSHGEIERAVQIRQSLIVRPGIDSKLAAKTWYELGKDFRRGGFLDRASDAFQKAVALGGKTPEIIYALAGVAAGAGDFEQAAKCYQDLKNPVAEAHYLVWLAKDYEREKNYSAREKYLKKAAKVYPGSPELWLFYLESNITEGKWELLAKNAARALATVDKSLHFVLLQGMLEKACTDKNDTTAPLLETPFQVHPPLAFSKALLPVLEKQDPDLLLYYYLSWMLYSHEKEASKQWLLKALVLEPKFWPARLELLSLELACCRNGKETELSQAFMTQLEFFIKRARNLSRFFCRNCGLKRRQLFFLCPRCNSWHSIKYNTIIDG